MLCIRRVFCHTGSDGPMQWSCVCMWHVQLHVYHRDLLNSLSEQLSLAWAGGWAVLIKVPPQSRHIWPTKEHLIAPQWGEIPSRMGNKIEGHWYQELLVGTAWQHALRASSQKQAHAYTYTVHVYKSSDLSLEMISRSLLYNIIWNFQGDCLHNSPSHFPLQISQVSNPRKFNQHSPSTRRC